MTSIIIKLVFTLYTVMNLKKMILHEDNVELFYTELIDFDENFEDEHQHNVHYSNETDMFMYYMLTK